MIKKIAFIFGILSLGLVYGLFGTDKASASTNDDWERLTDNIGDKYYFVFSTTDVDILIISTGKFIVNDDHSLQVTAPTEYYKSVKGANNFKRQNFDLVPPNIVTRWQYVNPVITNHDIMSTRTNEAVFLVPQTPWLVATTSMMAIIPAGVMGNLVDGGILLVALVIFAILLGTYWVARYLSSRSH